PGFRSLNIFSMPSMSSGSHRKASAKNSQYTVWRINMPEMPYTAAPTSDGQYASFMYMNSRAVMNRTRVTRMMLMKTGAFAQKSTSGVLTRPVMSISQTKGVVSQKTMEVAK